MKRGKLIVIEGVDGCGKSTQFELLMSRLKSTKNKVRIVDFPRYYDSVWGKLVGEFLTGKFGKFKEVDPHLAVLTYMVDEYTWGRDIGSGWLAKGDMVLSNRYFTSNVHQIAKLKGKARADYRNWLWKIGYDHLKIIKPDLVIFLDVPPSISKKMNLKKVRRAYLKGKKKDNAEKDLDHQIQSYKEYLYTVKNNPYWKRVKCVTRGKLDSPELIHDRIWKVVEGYL